MVLDRKTSQFNNMMQQYNKYMVPELSSLCYQALFTLVWKHCIKVIESYKTCFSSLCPQLKSPNIHIHNSKRGMKNYVYTCKYNMYSTDTTNCGPCGWANVMAIRCILKWIVGAHLHTLAQWHDILVLNNIDLFVICFLFMANLTGHLFTHLNQ